MPSGLFRPHDEGVKVLDNPMEEIVEVWPTAPRKGNVSVFIYPRCESRVSLFTAEGHQPQGLIFGTPTQPNERVGRLSLGQHPERTFNPKGGPTKVFLFFFFLASQKFQPRFQPRVDEQARMWRSLHDFVILKCSFLFVFLNVSLSKGVS
jgi:hypothetical protein